MGRTRGYLLLPRRLLSCLVAHKSLKRGVSHNFFQLKVALNFFFVFFLSLFFVFRSFDERDLATEGEREEETAYMKCCYKVGRYVWYVPYPPVVS